MKFSISLKLEKPVSIYIIWLMQSPLLPPLFQAIEAIYVLILKKSSAYSILTDTRPKA